MKRLLLLLLVISGQDVFSSRLKENTFSDMFSRISLSLYQESDKQSIAEVKREDDSELAEQNNSKDVQISPSTNSILVSGRWVKAQTTMTGIHKITFSALKSMGFSSPGNVKVFGFPPGTLPQKNNVPTSDDLIQYSLWKTKDKQSNDCLYIYVPGSINWEIDHVTGLFRPNINQFAQGRTILYLTEDVPNVQPVQQAPPLARDGTIVVSEFDDYSYFEEENYNLIGSGSRWYSSRLIPNATLTKNFKFPDHVANEPVIVSVAAAGRCEFSSTLDVIINSLNVQTLNFSPYSNFTEADYGDFNESGFSKIVNSDNLSFTLKYNAAINGICWLDYLRVQTRRKLSMQPGQFQFRDSRSVGAGNVAEFRIENATTGLMVWDISSPLNPKEIQSYTILNALSFRIAADSLHQFIAFDPLADFPGVEQVEVVINQNLHGLATPEMLIVSSPDFNSEAERLASFHRQNSGMDVSVVPVSQIYNEFSGGIADPTAIRNFVRHLYYNVSTNNSSRLKYLLLFGKGTYDNVHPLSSQNPCFIPTWQSENSINPVSSFVSDDYFGLLGKDEGGQTGIVAIGIGRIPCVNRLQAKAAVDKILHYNSASTLGEWRNNLCFVADDQDNSIHMSDSEQLANYVNINFPAFYTDKIYLDAFKLQTTPVLSYPAVNKAINDRIKDGTLLINYVGHANEEEWAAEKVLTISDIDSWNNFDKLPVFVTATCEFSRWDMTDKESAGEHVLFNQVGGGVALFSTTRMVYSSSNFEMNKSFFRHVFEKDDSGNDLRLGDIIRRAKSEMGGTINASKFGLLGDPALQISYPKYSVKTLEINNQVVDQLTDTIKPLSIVSVWGEIQNLKGEKLIAYNGSLYPRVYDKSQKISTLGNNGQSPFTYSIQNSILFKGNVSVKQGEFSYSFEIPKEIDYRIGNGLIMNYSKDVITDANGCLTSFKLGGSPGTVISDLTGPKVKLFLDNENFKNGDKVSKTPLLLADLEDETGINTSGSAIGHDIVVTIDNQTDKVIVLNSYFQAGLDTYKNGKVIFQLPELKDGVHTLSFKVWDLANNSTEVEIRFVVSAKLVIKSVIVFPNPFSEYIDFILESNRFGEKMKVGIEIFSQQGELVDQILTESASSGFTTQPIRWKPGFNNHRLAAGMYYYRIRLTTLDGYTDVKTGQLIYTR